MACRNTLPPSAHPPSNSTPYSKGVRYFHTSALYPELHGAMDTMKAGHKAKKHIIVRPSRHHLGLHELYTYHFPTRWSEACVANRELIKLAQRQAHTIERNHSYAALEWRIRFLHQYYSLPAWNKSMTDVPVEKRRYPHFYSYVFTTIYHALKSAQTQLQAQAASQAQTQANTKVNLQSPMSNLQSETPSFEPIYPSRHYIDLLPTEDEDLAIKKGIFCANRLKKVRNFAFFCAK